MTEPWGGRWTDVKLDVLGKYYQAFQTALKHKDFRTWYIDALAGDGKGNPRPQLPLLNDEDLESAEDLRQGSAALALNVSPAFDRYRLNEQSKKKRESLEKLAAAAGVDVKESLFAKDANKFVLDVLNEISSAKDRGVVLLDPFGMQVDWATLAAIVKKGEQAGAWLDLWYLFPTNAMVRMLPKKGPPIQEWQDRLDTVLGDSSWRSEFYVETSRSDLFEENGSKITRVVSFDSVEAFVVRRLKSLFQGTVLENPLRLGPVNKPIFSLFFASGNPSLAAKKLTKNLAEAIVEANKPRLL